MGLITAPSVGLARKEQDVTDFLLFMNNDCSLPSHTVASLLDTFEQHSDAGIVAPACTALGGPQEPLWIPDKSRPFRVTFVLGACLMMRRSLWDYLVAAHGYGLDPDMPQGADDHDLCLRAKVAGYSIWVDPRTTAQHKGHASGDDPNWHLGNGWPYFDSKWAGYFANSEEASLCHWGGRYVPGYEVGTGWSADEYDTRMRKG